MTREKRPSCVFPWSEMSTMFRWPMPLARMALLVGLAELSLVRMRDPERARQLATKAISLEPTNPIDGGFCVSSIGIWVRRKAPLGATSPSQLSDGPAQRQNGWLATPREHIDSEIVWPE